MKFVCSLLVFLAFVSVSLAADAPTWGYSETSTTLIPPSQWVKVNAQCGGSHQSPINLSTAQDQYIINLLYGRLNISYTPDRTLDLLNNGHTTVVSDLSNSMYSDDVIRVPGLLKNDYKLAQFHFHWGQADTSGSEHTVNSRGYPAELHLVHYNSKFSSFANAVASGEPDALAVVGVFYTIGSLTPAPLSALINVIPSVSEPGEDTNVVGPLNLRELIPNDLSYWTYSGSLTTPNCNEIVRWIVLEKPMPITRSDLAILRSTLLEVEVNLAKQSTDFRPTQALNGRVINYYPDTQSQSAASIVSPTLLLVAVVLLIAYCF